MASTPFPPLRRLDERLRRGGQDQHRPPRTRGRSDDLHALRGTAQLRALLQGARSRGAEPTGEAGDDPWQFDDYMYIYDKNLCIDIYIYIYILLVWINNMVNNGL